MKNQNQKSLILIRGYKYHTYANKACKIKACQVSLYVLYIIVSQLELITVFIYLLLNSLLEMFFEWEVLIRLYGCTKTKLQYITSVTVRISGLIFTASYMALSLFFYSK